MWVNQSVTYVGELDPQFFLPKGEMELSPDHRLKGDALGIKKE